jgi:AbrB family looped-hinge helix DNA binding protein
VYDIFNSVGKNYLVIPFNRPEETTMHVVTTSKRGQIVIPRDVRKQLRIIPGKKLLIKAEGDHAIITPLPDDPVEHFCGIFAGKPSLTKALVEERRAERKHEAKKSAR